MTALPPSTDWTGASQTEAQFKTAQTALRDFLSGLLGTDGLTATALSTLATILNGVSAKSGAYTVVAGDRGKLIDATTGTWSLSFTAAATLGAGFAFAVRNSGSGTITLDPNASETIDGATTTALAAGESCLVVCNNSATAWLTVGKNITLTSGTITTALGYTPATSTHNHSGVYVPVDVGRGAVGSFSEVVFQNPGGAWPATTTQATLTYVTSGNTVTSGTYRFMTDAGNNSAGAYNTLVQRIS